jgi:alpha-mannosidase
VSVSLSETANRRGALLLDAADRGLAIDFRPVAANDGQALLTFWLGMSDESKRTYRPYGEETYSLSRWQAAAERYAMGPDIGVVAIDQTEAVVGLAVVDDPTGLHGPPNFGIGVDDRYHRRGVGTTLTRMVLEGADKASPVVTLKVVNYNVPAQHLYKKVGFRFTGPPSTDADGLTYFHMTRERDCTESASDATQTEGRPRDWVLYVVPGSHFDLGWVASAAEALAWGDEIIRAAVDAIVGPSPDYRFTVEYALFMQHFLASYPEYLETVRDLVQQGKLEVCASMTGLMHQVLDGELMLRQVTYAQDWAQSALGQRLVTCQCTDLSGYSLQFPQLLARSGVKYMSYSRFHPPIPLHWWRAPDGSRVLAANHPYLYFWGLSIRRGTAKEALPKQLEALEACWPVDALLMADEYDNLMGDPSIVEKAAELEGAGLAKFKVSTISQFFEAVGEPDLPTYQGEAPYAIYSIHAANTETYLEARRAENLLSSAEKLSVLRELAHMGRYPYQALREGWEALFYPQDHNVGGKHGKLSAELRRCKALSSRIAADQVIQEGMLELVTGIGYSREDALPIVVYNPSAWERSETVHTYVEASQMGKNGLHVTNIDGTEVPCQLLHAESSGDRERVDHAAVAARRPRSWLDFEFYAGRVPALGYRVFYVTPDEEHSNQTVWREPVADGVVEARHFILRLGEDGVVQSLVWKQRGVDLVGKAKHDFNEVFVMEDLRYEIEIAHEAEQERGYLGEDADEARLNFTGKEWRSHLRVNRIEEGPLHTTILLEGSVLDAPVSQEIVLFENSPRVDFVTRIDWQGAKHTQTRIAYPFNVPEGRITYEVPFGSVRVGKDELPGGYTGSARFVQKWIDVSNDDYGVMFSTRSGDHHLSGQTISPIVIRSGYGEAEMDFWYENKGTFEFAFSIVPHETGPKSDAGYRQGWEFNSPLITGSLASVVSIEPIPGRTMPEVWSLCELDSSNLVLTSLSKRDNGGREYVGRLFETDGLATTAVCRFGAAVRRAWKTNLLGDTVVQLPVETGGVTIEVTPHEIYQFSVEFEDPPAEFMPVK